MKEIYTIDAKDKTVGRIASQVATILIGKNKASYQRNIAPAVKVSVINAAKAYIPLKKLTDKVYHHHTGHPGGHKPKSMEKIIEKKGHKEIFRKAIYNMLPKNRLRAIMLKNLVITD